MDNTGLVAHFVKAYSEPKKEGSFLHEVEAVIFDEKQDFNFVLGDNEFNHGKGIMMTIDPPITTTYFDNVLINNGIESEEKK